MGLEKESLRKLEFSRVPNPDRELLDARLELEGLLLVYPGRHLELPERKALRVILDAQNSAMKRANLAEGQLEAIGKILDNHYDAECVNVEEGSWVGGYDPGAIGPIADIVRPK